MKLADLIPTPPRFPISRNRSSGSRRRSREWGGTDRAVRTPRPAVHGAAGGLTRTLVALAGLAVPVAGRAAVPESGQVRLEAWLGGIDGAAMLISKTLDPGDYEVHVDVRSNGLVNWLTGLQAEVDGRGRLGSEGPLPRAYSQHIATTKGDHLVEVRFAGDPPLGTMIHDLDQRAPGGPRDERDKTPPPPEDQVRGALDPLAALLALGRQVSAGESRVAVRVFDGKLVYDLTGQVSGPARHNIDGREFSSLDLELAPKPLSGFKPFQFKTWSAAKVQLSLDPRTGLPLRISSDSFFTPVLVSVRALCPPDPDCALPKDKE